jgi:hypothetical protein
MESYSRLCRRSGGSSAFPSIPDKKGHDGQHTEGADRQGAYNRILRGKEFVDREAVEGENHDPFHDKPEAERDEPHTKPDTGKRRQHESVDRPARCYYHGQKMEGNFHRVSDTFADMQRQDLKPNNLQHESCPNVIRK